jgi:hypothetical protein
MVRSDGTVSRAENNATTLFAVVTNFKASQSIALEGPATQSQVLATVDQALPSKNYFQAVKIHEQIHFGNRSERPQAVAAVSHIGGCDRARIGFPATEYPGRSHALDFEIGDAAVQGCASGFAGEIQWKTLLYFPNAQTEPRA